MDKCTACGICAEKCPTVVEDKFNEGLGKRKAIYKLYAQAIPSGYAIDAENCRFLGQGKKCQICAKLCPADAIDYEQKDEMLNLEVGSVILAAGFKAFDPSGFETYSYASHPNVVTSMQFERLLSAGGPTAGHLERPSDLAVHEKIAKAEKGLKKTGRELKRLEKKHGKSTDEVVEQFTAGATGEDYERWASLAEKLAASETKLADLKAKEARSRPPSKIAWLQCVGSRDLNTCDNAYCSGVCCMYAIKEAVIAKEHSKDPLDTAIFYMDMRTHGKEFDDYYNRAQGGGVRFVRCRVHTVSPVPDSDNLNICYATDGGKLEKEEFDMVVLSVGLEASASAVELADKLGIELNQYKFARTGSFAPVSTSSPGIYACGALQGPKDIPFSVMEASAAAGAAGSRLAEARHSLVKEKVFPEERDVSAESLRIGVFVCNCGVNIGGVVRVPEVAEYAKTLPNVVYVQENLFSCSQDAQQQLVEVIKEQNLNRVVVASCSPRTHEPLFQETLRNSALNKYLYEQANIRDQCSWVHSNNPDAATVKAKDLVRMAVSRASLIEALPVPSAPVTPCALVVGGGVAGMVSALNLGQQGFKVHLVEEKERLGGHALKLDKTWRGENISEYVSKLIDDVNGNENIDVHLSAKVNEVSGFVGNFKTSISSNGGGDALEVEHGVALLATGAHSIKPDEYLYGKNERVFRWHELDKALETDLVKNASSAVFIQCVGSREPDRPYCSKICCTFSVQKAVELKELNPDMDVYILYRDMRTYGEREDLYREARARGVIFVRYDLENKPVVKETDGGALEVTVIDHVLGRPITLKPDFITLATAIYTRGIEELGKMFKVSISKDNFFLEAHMKLRPVDFATDGIFVCGMAHYPKPIEESIAQALAAAARAANILSQKSVEVEPIVSVVDQENCIGCGLCEVSCPFGAIRLVKIEGTGYRAENISALCKGCGICAGACPQKAIDMNHFRDRQIFASIQAGGAAA